MPNVLEPKYPSAMRQFLKLKFVQSRTILFMPWINVAEKAKRERDYPIKRRMASGFARFLISILVTKSESSGKDKIAPVSGKKQTIPSFVTGLMWQEDERDVEKKDNWKKGTQKVPL